MDKIIGIGLTILAIVTLYVTLSGDLLFVI